MELRIHACTGLACGLVALAGAARPAAAQFAPVRDSLSPRPAARALRLDAAGPWRRSRVPNPLLGSGTSVLATPRQRPFRLLRDAVVGAPAPDGQSSVLAALAHLLIPIRGITRDELHDSFGAPRVGHRHQGIDIIAPRGTPIRAAVDGEVIRMKWDSGGGRTIREVDASGKYVLYYAHLSGYARGLHERQQVRRGQVIGYVGRTGTVHGSAHLHLAIASLLDGAAHWWRIHPLNPYSLLRRARAQPCDTVTGPCVPPRTFWSALPPPDTGGDMGR